MLMGFYSHFSLFPIIVFYCSLLSQFIMLLYQKQLANAKLKSLLDIQGCEKHNKTEDERRGHFSQGIQHRLRNLRCWADSAAGPTKKFGIEGNKWKGNIAAAILRNIPNFPSKKRKSRELGGWCDPIITTTRCHRDFERKEPLKSVSHRKRTQRARFFIH